MPGGRQGGHNNEDVGDQSGRPSSLSVSLSLAAPGPTEIAHRERLHCPDCISGDAGGSQSKQARQVVPDSISKL